MKQSPLRLHSRRCICSIHPQGWVPVETCPALSIVCNLSLVAFTPKGGCPLKRAGDRAHYEVVEMPRSIHPQGWVPVETRKETRSGLPQLVVEVAFTPKGGCPLKHFGPTSQRSVDESRSIHPQGWVPVETFWRATTANTGRVGSIHPQGWVPVETNSIASKIANELGW